MIALVHARHNREHQIATVFHPEAQGETLETKMGNVRVSKGDPAYQLTTGEIVSL
jgi:hypothetical protein